MLIDLKRYTGGGEAFIHVPKSIPEGLNESYCSINDGKSTEKVQVALTIEACRGIKRIQISGKDSNQKQAEATRSNRGIVLGFTWIILNLPANIN